MMPISRERFRRKKDLAVESRIKRRGKGEDFHFLLFCDTDFFQSFSSHRDYENKNVFNCFVLESFVSRQIKTY